MKSQVSSKNTKFRAPLDELLKIRSDYYLSITRDRSLISQYKKAFKDKVVLDKIQWGGFVLSFHTAAGNSKEDAQRVIDSFDKDNFSYSEWKKLVEELLKGPLFYQRNAWSQTRWNALYEFEKRLAEQSGEEVSIKPWDEYEKRIVNNNQVILHFAK
jgi:hypothetical protein